MGLAFAALVLVLAAPAQPLGGLPVLHAQPTLTAQDGSPEVVGDALRVRVVGTVLSQSGRLTARRAAARRGARARATRRLHRWLDDVLASGAASPAVATAVHAALDEHARVVAQRPLVDGSIVLVLSVPLAELRAAGLPSLDGR